MTNEERRPPERPIPEYLESDYRYVVSIGFEEQVDIRSEVETLGGTVLQEQTWGEWATVWIEAGQIEQPLDSDYRYVVSIGFEEEVDIRSEVEALGGTVLQEQIWGEWETESIEAEQIELPWWKRLLARLRLVR